MRSACCVAGPSRPCPAAGGSESSPGARQSAPLNPCRSSRRTSQQPASLYSGRSRDEPRQQRGSARHSGVVNRRWVAVALAAVAVAAVAGAGCSGTGSAGAQASGQEGRSSPRPTARRPGPAIWDVAVAGRRLAFAAGTIGLERSADGGRSWTAGASTRGSYFQLNVVSERLVFAVGRGEVVRAVNGGGSWDAPPPAPARAGGSGVIKFLSAPPRGAADPTPTRGNPDPFPPHRRRRRRPPPAAGKAPG